MRVIVTRPERAARGWVASLVESGLHAVALPLIVVGDAPDPQTVAQAWQDLERYDAVMFVSGNAVDQFFRLKPASAPEWRAQSAIKTRAYVIGPGSRSALLRNGVDSACIDAPDAQAGQFDSEALWALVGARVQPGFRVLIVRGTGPGSVAGEGAGRDWFSRQVQSRGGEVEFVVSYQRSCPEWGAAERDMAGTAANDGSVWLFSSSEAIANLQARLPDQNWHAARALATHPRIAARARQAGFGVVCESRPTLEAVMSSIKSSG